MNNTGVLKPTLGGISLLVIGIISTIMFRYPITNKVYYLFLILLFFMIIINVVKANFQINKKNLPFITAIFFSMCCMLISSMFSVESMKFFITRYSLIFLTMCYLYMRVAKYGIVYLDNFYKQLTVLLNVFSVFNLYQVIFHKPLLMNYMQFLELGYNYHFGTSAYRTMSVFNHPIICGLFFIIAFFCNIYILKTPWKYLLQFLLLINIYSTLARSAWLAFAIVLIIYCVMNAKKILPKSFNVKLNFKRILGIYISCVLLIIATGFVGYHFESIYNGVISRFGDSLSSDTTDGSNLQRTMTISLIVNYMVNGDVFHLFFGYGLGKSHEFMLEHPILIEGFGTTDNQYLSWFYEFGLFGIGGYFSFILLLFIKVLKAKRNLSIELSFFSFLILSIGLFFFEGTGWPILLIMYSIALSCLSLNFRVVEQSDFNKAPIQGKKELPSVSALVYLNRGEREL
mgnify:CR=1 FL=1